MLCPCARMPRRMQGVRTRLSQEHSTGLALSDCANTHCTYTRAHTGRDTRMHIQFLYRQTCTHMWAHLHTGIHDMTHANTHRDAYLGTLHTDTYDTDTRRHTRTWAQYIQSLLHAHPGVPMQRETHTGAHQHRHTSTRTCTLSTPIQTRTSAHTCMITPQGHTCGTSAHRLTALAVLAKGSLPTAGPAWLGAVREWGAHSPGPSTQWEARNAWLLQGLQLWLGRPGGNCCCPSVDGAP